MTARLWIVTIIAQLSLQAASLKEFTDWPAGRAPTEIGKRVAERFAASGHLRSNTIIYPEVCAWYGGLTFARATNDKDLSARLIRRFDRLLEPGRVAPGSRGTPRGFLGVWRRSVGNLYRN